MGLAGVPAAVRPHCGGAAARTREGFVTVSSRMPAFEIMGVVNVTPDSFSDGGLLGSDEAAVAHARRLVEEGAAIVDVGGESTRPGADPVPAEQESERVVGVVAGIAALGLGARISVDTMKRSVA